MTQTIKIFRTKKLITCRNKTNEQKTAKFLNQLKLVYAYNNSFNYIIVIWIKKTELHLFEQNI